jgi:acyltransferase
LFGKSRSYGINLRSDLPNVRGNFMKRVEWIDVAKGIGIALVVLGHIGDSLPKGLSAYIYSFHMPLFFFLSGYLYKNKKIDFLSFVKKKARTLLIPYFFFAFSTYLFWLFIGRKFGDDASLNISFLKPLIGIFYSNGIDNWLIFNVPLWFLTCLFCVEVMFYLITKFISSHFLLSFVLIVFSVIGYLDSLYMPIRLPWGIDVAFTAIVFYGIGYIVKNIASTKLFTYFNYNSLRKFLLMISLLAIHFFVSDLNGRVDMNETYYNNYFLFYISAFSGLTAYILISQFLAKSKILQYFGKNTLVILALHLLGLTFIKGILVFGLDFSLDQTKSSLLWAFLYTILDLVILVPAIYIINKYFPFVLGKSKVQSFSQEKEKLRVG